MSWASSFRILAGSRLGPQALAGLSFSNSLTTPCSVTLRSPIDGKGVPSGIRMSSLSSFVPVDSYWRFKMSAFSFGSSCSLPFSLRGTMPLLSLLSDFMKLKSRFCFG